MMQAIRVRDTNDHNHYCAGCDELLAESVQRPECSNYLDHAPGFCSACTDLEIPQL